MTKRSNVRPKTGGGLGERINEGGFRPFDFG